MQKPLPDTRLPSGAASSAIHTPTISSTTTREGSSPQNGSSLLDDQIPPIVKRIIRARVNSHTKLKGKKYSRIHHTTVASNLGQKEKIPLQSQ